MGRRVIPLLVVLLPLAAAPLGAQAGNLNFHMGMRFDGGKRFPSLGAELQLGPRPWFVKGTAGFYAGFLPAEGTDYEGSLGAVWIRERSDAAFYPYLGGGGALIARRFPWGTDSQAAGFIQSGVLLRRGTNGNWGLDLRFLNGPARQLLGGGTEPVRYLQITVFIGWGW